MNKRLLDDIIHDMDKEHVDSESIRDTFVEVGRQYIESTDDPTIDNVQVLVEHFEDRDPDEIDEEALSLMWSMGSVLQWMIDDLPLNNQTTDPEWLHEQYEFWSDIHGVE